MPTAPKSRAPTIAEMLSGHSRTSGPQRTEQPHSSLTRARQCPGSRRVGDRAAGPRIRLKQDGAPAFRARAIAGSVAGLALAGDEEHPRRGPSRPALCIGTAWALSPAAPRYLSRPPLSQSSAQAAAITADARSVAPLHDALGLIAWLIGRHSPVHTRAGRSRRARGRRAAPAEGPVVTGGMPADRRRPGQRTS